MAPNASWLVADSATRHNSPAFISIINDLCAWVQGRQERLLQHPARLWCHPTGAVTSSKKVLQQITQKNPPERWDWPDTGRTKGPLVPICLELLPQLTSFTFFFFFFVIGGINIKPSDFPEQVTDWRARKKNNTGVCRFQFRPEHHFYSVLFKVKKKTSNSIVRLFIQKCCFITFLHRASLRDLEIAQKRVRQYRHHRNTHWLFVLHRPSHLEPVGSKVLRRSQENGSCSSEFLLSVLKLRRKILKIISIVKIWTSTVELLLRRPDAAGFFYLGWTEMCMRSIIYKNL